MNRITKDGKTYLEGFHTQEFRENAPLLDEPILCKKNAWLGIGYYFWIDEEFAHYWGEDFKKRNTGYYDIYTALLDVENCIDTTFNEKGYYFFKEKIEAAIQNIRTNSINITLQELNRYLKKEFWTKLGVTGIIYDDLPVNPLKKDRIYSEVEYTFNQKKQYLYYKKRIQVVIFNLEDVYDFEIHKEELTQLC